MKPRFAMLAGSAVMLVGLLAGCGGGSAGTSQNNAGNPASSTKGVTIRVVLANHPWTDGIKKLLPDFESKTGIHVNLESYGETQLTQKLTTEFTSGNSDIDVFAQRPLQEARLFVQNGWYQDLNGYVKDQQKTPADWQYNDFFPSALQTENVNGTLTGIPIVVEHEVLYYRKDLFAKANLQPPKTIDELVTDAQKLTDKSQGIYGFVARGDRQASVTQFSSFLYSYGGDWFDQQTKKATLNTPEAIQAFETYGTLLKDYGPPGTLNMSWPQAAAVFAQGKAAMWTDADSVFQNVTDPSKSQVAQNVGIAKFPAGPKGSIPYSVTSWGLSIPKTAPHKDAAWQFIVWATSPDTVKKLQTGSSPVPGARASLWNDEDMKSFPSDWVAAAKASADGRPYDRPLVVQVGQARDVIGTVIDTGIQGGDVTAAANSANQQFQQLLDTEKK